jgi:hypothetical protein
MASGINSGTPVVAVSVAIPIVQAWCKNECLANIKQQTNKRTVFDELCHALVWQRRTGPGWWRRRRRWRWRRWRWRCGVRLRWQHMGPIACAVWEREAGCNLQPAATHTQTHTVVRVCSVHTTRNAGGSFQTCVHMLSKKA